MVRKNTFRKLRESAGMTQAEMAELLRVPLSTLEKWETDPTERWEADSLDMKAKALLGLAARPKQ
jgi:DNA-binding transcriptional regulator YiaG